MTAVMSEILGIVVLLVLLVAFLTTCFEAGDGRRSRNDESSWL